MFEEAQLYSPVTTGAGGEVTVHLHAGHPGALDPDYRRRRSEIAAAALAWRPGAGILSSYGEMGQFREMETRPRRDRGGRRALLRHLHRRIDRGAVP